MEWTIHHRAETDSTNRDALQGSPGDVFTADFQTAGRGRLGHTWEAPPQENLILSAVLQVADLPPEQVATLPLAVGHAVLTALARFLPSETLALKWPNDIFVRGRKICGILCERHGDRVIAGLGVNVLTRAFPAEIAARATSLALEGALLPVSAVRDAVLDALADAVEIWRRAGFGPIHAALKPYDFLAGRVVSVRQTDDDPVPLTGLSSGIALDGSLDVAGQKVYAGEAHLMGF